MALLSFKTHIFSFVSFPHTFQPTKEFSIRNYLLVSIFEVTKVGGFGAVLGLHKNRVEDTEFPF